MNKLCLFLFCLFSSIQIFAQNNIPSYVPTNGLVGWWPFNGNANDESGNGNNGIVYGATLTSDRFGNIGKSYLFNGNSNYIEVQSSSNITVSSAYTISAWFNSDLWSFNSPIDEHAIISKIVDGAWYGGYEIYLGGNSGRIFHIGNIGDNFHLGSAGNIANKWYNVTATFNGNIVRYYLDGIKLDSISLMGNIGTSSIPLRFGRRGGAGTYNCWFSGKIDDIAIYNRALTQDEITALYTGQTTNNPNTDTISKPVPPGIPYQAVIRNASGQIMTNANVTAQFTLHKDSALGGVEYQEVHALTTNGHGLINTVLGKGTATQGTFASINWANTNKFLQVQMDLGNGYVDLGTQQLMSVPYAMYAANGPKGEKGDKGDSGVAGPQGLQGVQGPPGNGFQNGTINGQMLYWKDSVWVTVSPGTNGQTLTLCNGLPHWGPCPVDTILPTQITIGSQIWDNKNLDVSTYRNGDPIPQVTDTIQWANLTTGAWCWYNNDSANYWQYGKLYNWFAVNDPRGLAPIGWHVPTDGEWNKIVKFLEPSADTTLSGWQNTTVGGMLKSTTNWNSPNTGATNSSGFGALPGGRRFSSGYFSNVGNFGYWWSSTESNASFAWYRYLSSTSLDIHRFNFNKVVGFSVRLIKD